jgi:hypothetical protein
MRCSPPLEADELASIAHWVVKHSVRDELDQLNERFGIIQLGGQVVILDAHGDGSARSTYELMNKESFHTLLSDRWLTDKKGKPKRLSQVWLDSPFRRMFSSIVFDPTGAGPADAFNIWRGFAVEPTPNASCDLLLEHILENVCDGNLEHYAWVMGWFAAIFQNPLRKLGTALVLKGKQGTGKSIVGQAVGHLLGRHYLPISVPRYITGNFNAHLERVLLLQAEEAFFTGDKMMEGALKDLITGERMLSEPKYVNPYEVPNLVRLFVTTNERWSVPAGDAERRFTVLDVSDRRRNDNAYFGAIQRQLAEGGYGKLLHFLLNYRYDEATIRRVLITSALGEQQDFSMPNEQKWWQAILHSGVLPGDAGGEGISVNRELHGHYIEYCKAIGAAYRQTDVLIGKFLMRVAPFVKHEVRAEAESVHPENRPRQQVREFPSLKECRRLFDEYTGREHDWGEPWRWVVADDM